MSRWVMTPDSTYHEFPDGTSDAQISEALGSGKRTGVAAYTRRASGWTDRLADAQGMAPAHRETGVPPAPTPLLPQQPVSKGIITPPLIGGLGGTMLGAPFGPPGMALGGMLGTMGGAALQGDNPQQIAAQGLGSAAGSLVAIPLQAAAEPVANWLARRAINPAVSLIEKYPGLIDYARKIGVMPQGWTPSGGVAANALETARQASSAAEVDIARAMGHTSPEELAAVAIRRAQVKGRTLSVADRQKLVDQVRDKAAELLTNRTHGILPEDVPAPSAPQPSGLLDAYGEAIPAGEAPPRPPRNFSGIELRQIKQYADDAARALFGPEAKGAGRTVAPLEKSVGQAARMKLRLNPEMERQLNETRNLIGLHQAMIPAEANMTRTMGLPLFNRLGLGLPIPAPWLGQASLAAPDVFGTVPPQVLPLAGQLGLPPMIQSLLQRPGVTRGYIAPGVPQ